MNKVISSKERVFMSLVGPSGCGKSQLIFDMLKSGTFQPEFDKIYYFYQYHQPLYTLMKQHIAQIEFIQCVDFEKIDKLPNDGRKYLLIFDDSCDEIMRSKSFEKLAIAGRHRNMSVIYIKHNLYHKAAIGRDAELQLTHIVLFKSPRDVQQIKRLGTQLGVNLVEWYNDATTNPYGHLMIDLNPKTSDYLRFCTNVGQSPTKFYIPKQSARVTIIDDEHTKHLYAKSLDGFSKQITKNVSGTLSKRIRSIPKRMRGKHVKRTFGY